jgi:PPOX class probable F420-dependent enzyme
VTPPKQAEQMAKVRYVILTTYRRNGQAVPTVVGAALDEHGRLCILTRPGSGKVKRIRNNPAVTVTPCDAQGRPKNPSVAGTARLMDPDETARVRRMLSRKHPTARVVLLADRLRPSDKRWTGIAVSI